MTVLFILRALVGIKCCLNAMQKNPGLLHEEYHALSCFSLTAWDQVRLEQSAEHGLDILLLLMLLVSLESMVVFVWLVFVSLTRFCDSIRKYNHISMWRFKKLKTVSCFCCLFLSQSLLMHQLCALCGLCPHCAHAQRLIFTYRERTRTGRGPYMCNHTHYTVGFYIYTAHLLF